jgi:hypothetical protein
LKALGKVTVGGANDGETQEGRGIAPGPPTAGETGILAFLAAGEETKSKIGGTADGGLSGGLRLFVMTDHGVMQRYRTGIFDGWVVFLLLGSNLRWERRVFS